MGGVLAIGGSIAALFILPMLHTAQSRSSTFRSYYKVGIWVWVASFILLGWVGQIGITDTIVFVGQVLTVIYFALLTVGVVVLGFFENAQTPNAYMIVNRDYKNSSTAELTLNYGNATLWRLYTTSGKWKKEQKIQTGTVVSVSLHPGEGALFKVVK